MSRRFSLFDSVRGNAPETSPPEDRDNTVPDEAAPQAAPDRAPLRLALAANMNPAWAMDLTGRMVVENDAFVALSPQMAEGLRLLSADLLGTDDEDIFDLAGGEGTLNLLWRSDGEVTVFSARFDRPAPAPLPQAA